MDVPARLEGPERALYVLHKAVPWLTAEEAAERLGVPVKTARDFLLALLRERKVDVDRRHNWSAIDR
jgi:hypothetical protein